MTHDLSPRRRKIRSFVLRAGRVTIAQQRALTEHWPHFGIATGGDPLDLDSLFGRKAPCTLEIGFGNGEHLAARARAEPERHFLGVEVHRPGIGQLLHQAAADHSTNLRVIAQDAVEVLQQKIAPESLDEVQILFPDPWPKTRHHKRRLIQATFATLVTSRLRLGGRLLLATDWVPYGEQMIEVLGACADLVRVVNNDVQPAARGDVAHRTPTRFERRGIRLGHPVTDLTYERCR